MASDGLPTEGVAVMVAEPRAWRGALEGLVDRLTRAIDLMLGLGMISAVLLNFANVLGRYVFGIAIVGADELLVYVMIATIFLGAVCVTWRDAHLRLDVLVGGLPLPIHRAAKRSGDLVLAVLCATVGIASASMAIEMAHFDQRSLAAGLPMVIPHGAVAIGMWLMALVALLRFFGLASRGEMTFTETAP